VSVALVDQRRGPDGGFRPVGVWLAVPGGIQGRYLRGQAELEAFRRRVVADARPPIVDRAHGIRGDWEDWAHWAARALTNGHDRVVREVEPEATLEALFRREVLGEERPRPGRRPLARVASSVPAEELGGYRRPAR